MAPGPVTADEVYGAGSRPGARPDYRVPILDVEDAIGEACGRWQVRQIVADPFRWAGSLQILAAEGLVLKFPQSSSG